MGYDELCPVSGIRFRGGPSGLVDPEELEQVASEIAREIVDGELSPQEREKEINRLSDILKKSIPASTVNEQVSWRPVGLGTWEGFDVAIAIGYFDEDGRADFDDHTPGGRGVEVRRVKDSYEGGDFGQVILPDGSTEERMSCCSATENNPNFFVLEGPYRYLEAWIDWGNLPPRSVAFPEDPEPISFAGEFYEIVNSRETERDGRLSTLPEINYGGIDKALDQYQDYFKNVRTSSENIRRGIQKGVQGDELLPSILQDFGCWMCMRPDLWPDIDGNPPDINENISIEPAIGTPSTPLENLPSEILLAILHNLTIREIMDLSGASKGIRSLILKTDFITRFLHESMTHGELQWIKPVVTVPGEFDRAVEQMSKWFGANYPSDPVNEPWTSMGFPIFEFVKACFVSDSMRNRKRLWGITKQYEDIWRDYRTNGWRGGTF